MTLKETLAADLKNAKQELEEALQDYAAGITQEKYERILELQRKVNRAKQNLTKWT